MSVQFILGRSGTGKTSYCIESIVDALAESAQDEALIFLVPEQATYQVERAILCDKRVAGYNRLHVLSFDRLQFLLLGKRTARPELSRIGQQMVIGRILREKASELRVFGSSATLAGLGAQITRTIIELHRWANTPESIEELMEKLDKEDGSQLTAMKFADIGLIFREYVKAIEGRFTDPDIQLTLARQAAGQAAFIKGSRLWVDGFAGFTASELAMLAELLKAAGETRIALCLDVSQIEPGKAEASGADAVGLFNPTQRTYAELVEIIKRCKLQLGEPIVLEKAVRFSCRQLGHIERDIFEPEPQKIKAEGHIRIVCAPSVRAEVRFAARRIVRLVREEGYRYRDIAVIASDIDGYQHYVRAYFDDYSIPFFIDKRKPLNQHPVVQLICSALRVVTEGFSSSDIFVYLRSGLAAVQEFDVDLLENYCLAFGIDGDDWQSGGEWHFAGKDDEGFDEGHINQIRGQVSRPLIELRDRICAGGNSEKKISVDEFTRIVFDFLERLNVRETISAWIEEAGEGGDYAAAEEHRQFYDRLVSVFDELVEVFAGQELRSSDFIAIVNSALSQLTLAFIPPSLDQVLVGSIERSRHPALKAVFLVGVTAKQFPVPVSFDSILTDDDRRAAESVDFALGPTVRQMLAERQYLGYIAFTRASEFLCISYPAADDKGGKVVRSLFVDSLESLFEDLGEESTAAEKVGIDDVYSEREVTDLLCSRLGKDRSGEVDKGGLLSRLLEDMCLDKDLAESGRVVLSAINYDNHAELDERIIEELFVRQIRTSATGLSMFAACPYQYFARHVLELRERKEFKFQPLDVGRFYHRVLDGVLKELSREEKDFGAFTDEELVMLVRGQIARLVQEDGFISNFAGRSHHNKFIIHSAGEILEACVPAIAQMVRAGSFRPRVSEVSFKEYEIGLPNNRSVIMRGKIDRLDIAHGNGERAGVVFDYKRREKSFSWAKFYYGLDMQLPIYMLAVSNAADMQPKVNDVVGAFYIPVEAKIESAAIDELAKRKESFHYKAKGIFSGDLFKHLDTQAGTGWSKFYNFYIAKEKGQYGHYDISGALKPGDFQKVLRFTEKKIVGLGGEILSGEISVKPYRLGTASACGWCKYKAVCRFDWQINDYNVLRSLGKLDVLEEMEGAGG